MSLLENFDEENTLSSTIYFVVSFHCGLFICLCSLHMLYEKHMCRVTDQNKNKQESSSASSSDPVSDFFF